MSRWIRIGDGRGRDARVRMEPLTVRCGGPCHEVDGAGIRPVKLIKTALNKSYANLRSRFGSDEDMANAIIECDPELDMEIAGREAGASDRVFLNGEGKLLYSCSKIDVIYDKNGRELERKEASDRHANIDTGCALCRAGREYGKEEAVKRFVFSRKYRLRHIDGLTFDFLFGMAEELGRKNAMALIGAGSRGRGPLVLERNGLPYRGFLEGRVEGNKYLLRLHLSHLELAMPDRPGECDDIV